MNLNYHIRPENNEDYSRIREVNILAFNNKEVEANLVELIRRTEFFIPELSLVAVKDKQEVIGHILFSHIFLETKKGTILTLGLAPMAVNPQYQNQGIGSRLVTDGLNICKNLGYQHIFVLGHPNYYPRFGFMPAKSFGISSPYPVPDEAFMAIEIYNDSLKNVQGSKMCKER